MDFKTQLAKSIATDGLPFEEVLPLVKKSDGVNGDFALPCFKFAKTLKTSPVLLAQKLAEQLKAKRAVKDAVAVNGYLNMFVDRAAASKKIAEEVLNKDSLADATKGAGKTVCIDYSSINIAKPFHIGHLGTTAIGSALYKVYKAQGYHVVGINHLGDWGTQFGKLIVAYRKWGDKEAIDKGGVRALQDIYVKFHREAETDPSLDDEARRWFAKIEQGDEYALGLFDYFKEITLKDVKKVYERLNVNFDSWNGESFYNDKMQPVIDALKQKGLAVVSDGALIVDLEKYGMPPCLLVKADGATLYATRDLAAAVYRHDVYDFDKCLYVVAYQQNLHFKQFFKVLELMGYDWASKMEHVAYGMVSLAEGSMSTRKGNAVWLSDVLDKAVEKSLDVIKTKSPDLANKEEIAEQVGVGAVVFSALANSRIKDIVFDYDRVLNFDGETAPYLQYAHARCCSILAKTEAPDLAKAIWTDIDNDESWQVLSKINEFDDVLTQVTDKNEPSLLSNYLIDLAQLYNKFYLANRVIDNGVPSHARLLLTDATRKALRQGLNLLGIAAPQKM